MHAAKHTPERKKPKPQVAARVSEEIDAKLDELAREERQSKSAIIERFIEDGVYASSERAALISLVTVLVNQVESQKTILGYAIQALLCSAGKVPPTQAQSWVEKLLLLIKQ